MGRATESEQAKWASGHKHTLSTLGSVLSPRREPIPGLLSQEGLSTYAFLLVTAIAALLFHPRAVQHPDCAARVRGSLWHGFYTVKKPLTSNPAGSRATVRHTSWNLLLVSEKISRDTTALFVFHIINVIVTF